MFQFARLYIGILVQAYLWEKVENLTVVLKEEIRIGVQVLRTVVDAQLQVSYRTVNLSVLGRIWERLQYAKLQVAVAIHLSSRQFKVLDYQGVEEAVLEAIHEVHLILDGVQEARELQVRMELAILNANPP